MTSLTRSVSFQSGKSQSRLMRSPSVQGGAGGSGVRVSSKAVERSFSMAIAAFSSGGVSALNISENKKVTMKNLNHRLFNYLNKVRTLEKANAELELKIKEFLENQAKPQSEEYAAHKAAISNLQDQILHASRTGGSLRLAIDNAELAADDFRVKFENELAMRQSVEADITGLKRALEDQTRSRSKQEMENKTMEEELNQLKKNHEEELRVLRSKIGDQINVEVEASPQQDLSATMAGIRQHYETVASNNRKALDTWFQEKVAELNKDVSMNTEALESSRSEVAELKRVLQGLEIDLQAKLSMKVSLEGTLAETQDRYGNMLAGYQNQVSTLEAQLAQLRGDLERQVQDYNMLLDMKSKMELELDDYNKLMDGDLLSPSTSTPNRKVLIITKEASDDEGPKSETKE